MVLLLSALVLPALAPAQIVYWPVSAGGNGHFYEAVASAGINWHDASKAATNKGGYLATITSEPENNLVYSLIKTNPAVWDQRPTGNSWGPWIGGLQPPGSAEPDGGWSWVTGEPFGYANWNQGEPSNDHGLEDRIHFWGAQAAVGDVWNDKPGTDSLEGFVIEYETHPNAVLLNLSRYNVNRLQLSWRSRLNIHYTVEWWKGLASTNWYPLTNVVGSGATCFVFDRISNMPRFYRVLSTP